METIKNLLLAMGLMIVLASFFWSPNLSLSDIEMVNHPDTIFLEPHHQDHYLAGWDDKYTLIVDTINQEFHLEFHYKTKKNENVKIFFKDIGGYSLHEFNMNISRSTILVTPLNYHLVKEGYLLIHNKKINFKIKL
jgi:hypothetical protein